MRQVLRAIVPLVGVFLWASQSAFAQTVVIAPSDTLALKVTQWNASESAVVDWPSLSGTYTVDADGAVDIPFVGRIIAAGKPPSDIGAAVSAALTQRFALADQPDAYVTIAARSPIVIGGMVRVPGTLPFRDGLTVREAIALAGGPAAGSDTQTIIESVTAKSDLAMLQDRETALTFATAREQAQLDGNSKIDFPSMPFDVSRASAIKASETQILTLEKVEFDSGLALNDSRVALQKSQIETLKAKIVALNRQKDLALSERSSTEALTAKGLALGSKMLSAEQALAAIETQILDVEGAILQAQQSIVEAETNRLTLVQGRAGVILTALSSDQQALADVHQRRMRQEVIVSLTPGVNARLEDSFEIVIHRVVDGTAKELRDGAIDQRLLPGDMIEVNPRIAPKQG
jgi:exopolysaccharide production protein ExoF